MNFHTYSCSHKYSFRDADFLDKRCNSTVDSRYPVRYRLDIRLIILVTPPRKSGATYLVTMVSVCMDVCSLVSSSRHNRFGLMYVQTKNFFFLVHNFFSSNFELKFQFLENFPELIETSATQISSS